MADTLDDQSWMLGAVTSVTLNDARMCIEMDVAAVACSLGIESELFEPFDTTFDAPFTLKRSGVEIRFAMDAPSARLKQRTQNPKQKSLPQIQHIAEFERNFS